MGSPRSSLRQRQRRQRPRRRYGYHLDSIIKLILSHGPISANQGSFHEICDLTRHAFLSKDKDAVPNENLVCLIAVIAGHLGVFRHFRKFDVSCVDIGEGMMLHVRGKDGLVWLQVNDAISIDLIHGITPA